MESSNRTNRPKVLDIEESIGGGIVRKTIDLDADNVEWFRTHYKGTSLTWLLNELMGAFRLVNDRKPQEYIDLAAKHLQAELEKER